MVIENEPIVSFETALGRCGIRWSEAGITGTQLPGPRLRTWPRLDDSVHVPGFVQATIDGITAVLDGQTGPAADLGGAPLDEQGIDPFRRRVYAATRTLAPGTTATYGEIARGIGVPDGARDVGAALARNPFTVIVPCHRVIAASGALTGFSAAGGVATKRRMLELEGAPGFGQQRLFG
jgi:methylated-DNA-[protein]-cysteine S-methyltransferase